MNQVLDFYKDNKEWINLAKDFVFLVGFIGLIKFLWTWNFRRKTASIEQNLKLRDNIGDKINEYVFEKHEGGIKDIGIRLVYWKNYPWRLENDAFNHMLWLRYVGRNTTPFGWIDKTGINFIEHIWWLGRSIYLNKYGIFFVDKEKKYHNGFEEFNNKILVQHMPFSRIINFDFKDYIDYEPVFYIRYKYTQNSKLYDDELIIANRDDDDFFQKTIYLSMMVSSPHSPKYYYLMAMALLKRLFKSSIDVG